MSTPSKYTVDDDTPVEHDLVAEQNDLLTLLEARARIEERMRPLRRRARDLEGERQASPDDEAVRADLEACVAELDELEQAFRRYNEAVETPAQQ